jgi:hypothetical protein
MLEELTAPQAAPAARTEDRLRVARLPEGTDRFELILTRLRAEATRRRRASPVPTSSSSTPADSSTMR